MEEVEGLSSPRSSRTALLRVACVCVTEYDSATSNYLEPLHARKVARAVERQLELIAARSLLKVESDLVPSCSATDSGPVEGKLGRCVLAVGDGSSWREPDRVGGHSLGRFIHAHNPRAVEHCHEHMS